MTLYDATLGWMAATGLNEVAAATVHDLLTVLTAEAESLPVNSKAFRNRWEYANEVYDLLSDTDVPNAEYMSLDDFLSLVQSLEPCVA